MTTTVTIEHPYPSKLPHGFHHFALTREAAAEALCICPKTFDRMVADGEMPQPRLLRSKLVWDVAELKEAFWRLPQRGGKGEANINDPWGTA